MLNDCLHCRHPAHHLIDYDVIILVDYEALVVHNHFFVVALLGAEYMMRSLCYLFPTPPKPQLALSRFTTP
jgi:hypothetical protein